MSTSKLSDYFDAVGAKFLSAVEVDAARSNQHEFNAVRSIVDAYGRPDEKLTVSAEFMYFGADEDDVVTVFGDLTIYDARAAHPNRSEYRMYYRENDVLARAAEGDLLIIAKSANSDRAFLIVASKGSSACPQLLFLFGLEQPIQLQFAEAAQQELDEDKVDFTRKLILEELQIAAPLGSDQWLDEMISKFGSKFPTTLEFSSFARSTLPVADNPEGADALLVALMDREQELFNSFDRHLLNESLKGLIDEYSSGDQDPTKLEALFLSRQNQRKSRAGHAFENHLRHILGLHSIKFEQQHVTENNSKPDFLFPSGAAYDDPSFDPSGLTMLGAKRTLKDRWRQVLSEAARVDAKHLITLQSPISSNQTDEMRFSGVQLVVPSGLHEAFAPEQREWLMSLAEFIEFVLSKQYA